MNTHKVLARIKKEWKLKIILGAILNAIFAVLYLVPQHHPIFHATPMPATFIDSMIPFLPEFVYCYESLYLLMPIAPWLMTTRKELAGYSFGILAITLAGFAFFILCPTIAPRPRLDGNANFIYETLIRMDTEGNAFPSLHVAFAVFHAAWCVKILSEISNRRILSLIFWTWAVLISFSTLLTKQHVFMDVLGGAALGFAVYALSSTVKPLTTLLDFFSKLYLKSLLNSEKLSATLSSIKDGIVNCYILKSDSGVICVDTGWRADHIVKELTKLGFSVNDVESVLLTHCHWDHAGCVDLFPNADIFVGERIAPAKLARLRAGVNRVRTVREKEKIKSAGFEFEMIPALGHTNDSVFWQIDHNPETTTQIRYVFTGDSIRLKNKRILPFHSFFNSDNESLEKSIAKLDEIKNIDFIVTSHYGILENQTSRKSATQITSYRKTINREMKT